MHTPEPRQPAPDTRQAAPLPGISVREAAVRIGTSESDIRRRIKRGELRAESIARPGGTLLRVLVDAPGAAPADAVSSESGHAPEPRQDAPALTTSLLAKLNERDETIATLYAENAGLRERVGRAEAASEAASSRASTLQAEIDRLRARRWWQWWA